jgi:hypothetical protein
LLSPFVNVTQTHQVATEIGLQEGLRRFIPETPRRGQRTLYRVTALLETAEALERPRRLVLHPHLEAAFTELAPDGGGLSTALHRRCRLAVEHGQSVGHGLYGFDAQSIRRRRLTYGLQAYLVPSSRQHAPHLQAQLVDTVSTGDERYRVGPDLAAVAGVRVQ